MNKWEILWNHREMILLGFRNTLILFSISAVAAFLLSCIIVLSIQTSRTVLGRVVRGLVDGMRMLPFLIYAYLLYYGLPSLGIRSTTAWGPSSRICWRVKTMAPAAPASAIWSALVRTSRMPRWTM